MQEERPRHVLIGIAIIGMLLGSIVLTHVPRRHAESVTVQENQFPRHIRAEPGTVGAVTHHRFSLGLFAGRYLDRVELRYSYLTLDASVNLTELNQHLQRSGNLSDAIHQIARLLSLTEDYPVKPEILDTHITLEGQNYAVRVYDFTRFFSSPPSSSPHASSSQVAKEALTAHLVIFANNGSVIRYYKGVSDFVSEQGTGLNLASVTTLRGADKEMYYAGGYTEEENVKPIEERPAMGVVRFDDVKTGSTLGVICNAEYRYGRAECLQLVRIYVNGRIEQVVANPVTVSG